MNIYVGYLPENFTENQLKEKFAQYGKVSSVKIIIDKDWTLGVSIFKSTKEKLDKYSENLEGDIELLIRYQFIIILIMSGQNSNALEQANSLLSHPKLKVRTEMEWYVRLLIIVIHFQLKNFTLLNHLFLSTKRYLHKKNNVA